MQLVFDKKPLKKRNKKKLFFTLITAELLGILILVWFLRTPLYEKYLTAPQKAYDTSKMTESKQYLVAQNDQLVGKGKPESKIKFYLSPLKKITSSRTDGSGGWVYQVPKDLPAGRYRLYVAEFDDLSKTVLIKNYRIRVASRGFFEGIIKKLSVNFVDKALAQDEFPELLPPDALITDPVIDPQISNNPVTNSDCPEGGCTDDSDPLEALRVPDRCDPDIPGNIILVNQETFEEESVYDESGVCSDNELGDGSYTPVFYRNPNDDALAFAEKPKSCPTLDQLKDNVNQCRLLNPNVNIFNTSFSDEQRQTFIDLYEKEFVGKEIFMDYVPKTINSDTLNIFGDQTREELKNNGYIIRDDKVYMIGTPDEFKRRVDFIISKSQQSGLNPAIFLAYWKPESYFSTAEGADFGCAPYLPKQNFGSPRKSFERELYCALGLNPQGEVPQPGETKTGSSGPQCAVSQNYDSISCRSTPKNRKVMIPPTTFDDLFVLHTDFAKTKGVIGSPDCGVSYNQTLEVITQLGACHSPLTAKVQLDFNITCGGATASPPRPFPGVKFDLYRVYPDETYLLTETSNQSGQGVIFYDELDAYSGVSYKVVPHAEYVEPVEFGFGNLPTDYLHKTINIEAPICN
jgi:hypothetical protein